MSGRVVGSAVASETGVAICDDAGRLCDFNEAFTQYFTHSAGGVKLGDTLGQIVAAILRLNFDGQDFEAMNAAWLARLSRRETTRHDLARADGMLLSVVYAPTRNGGWTIVIMDVTGGAETLDVLTARTIRFEAALAHMPLGLCMFDAARCLILCNGVYAALYNLPEALTQPGVSVTDIIAYRMASGNAPRDMTSYLKLGTDAQSSGELICRRVELSDGRWIEITHNPIPGGGYVSTHQDITASILADREIRYLAMHDTLTGTLNRLALRESLAASLLRPGRAGSLAVHCLDLDRFKIVNDTLGHPIGDQLMIAVIKRFRACLDARYAIGRIGGDEFVILQDGVETVDASYRFARRLIKAVEQPFVIEGHVVNIGLSIGTAFHPQHGACADELLKKADIALYRAKSDGRNTYRLFEPDMDRSLHATRALEVDFRRAMAAREFVLNYQPLVGVTTRRINGFEALLRWNHAERGPVSPAAFIPLAEETGLIVPLGDWVIRRACRDAARWPEHITVAVNLSSLQFRQPDLSAVVQSALSEAGLAPSRLELEITESVLLEDTDATLTTLHELRALGVRIALDDFGTGHSSLSYLRSFPFDKIKIDKSFIDDMDRRTGGAAIVRAIAGLGAALGMVTTAEGVETPAQLRAIEEQGCTEVQGFLLGRPRPIGEVPAMLACDEDAAAVDSALLS